MGDRPVGVAALAATGLTAVGSLVALAPSAGAAAKPAPAKRYANCTAMHRVYKGGVARPGAHDKRSGGGHARYAPYASARYNANKVSDRDKDGIACEQ